MFIKPAEKRFKQLFILPLSLMICFIIKPIYTYAEEYNIEKHLGLYKITEAKCQLSDGLYNPCNEMSFIELVKGRFYGIKPDELAFVLWSCDDSSTEYGCTYESYRVKNHKKVFMSENKAFLSQVGNQNESSGEYLLLKNGKIISYHFKLITKNKAGESFFRDFNYKLEKTSRDKINQCRLEYPDDM